jgi:universal stress protein E
MNQQRTRIVCATDLLPRSEAAVDRAGLLADATNADLMLLHVVAPAASEQALEQALQHAQSTLRLRAQPPVWRGARLPGTAIRAGNPARIVVDEVLGGTGVDLLVLGPHRRRPVRDALEGSIAGKVLASRACPVLLVNSRPDAEYRRVLLALDHSQSSAGAIRAAEQLVLSEDSIATVVHVDEPPYQGMLNYANVDVEHIAGYVQGWRSEATRDIRNLVRRESMDAARFSVHVESGHALRGILRAVDQYGPDLLVMGTRGGGALHRALLGSVANSVIRQVACDVMVAPEAKVRALGVPRAAASGRDNKGRKLLSLADDPPHRRSDIARPGSSDPRRLRQYAQGGARSGDRRGRP